MSENISLPAAAPSPFLVCLAFFFFFLLLFMFFFPLIDTIRENAYPCRPTDSFSSILQRDTGFSNCQVKQEIVI